MIGRINLSDGLSSKNQLISNFSSVLIFVIGTIDDTEKDGEEMINKAKSQLGMKIGAQFLDAIKTIHPLRRMGMPGHRHQIDQDSPGCVGLYQHHQWNKYRASPTPFLLIAYKARFLLHPDRFLM